MAIASAVTQGLGSYATHVWTANLHEFAASLFPLHEKSLLHKVLFAVFITAIIVGVVWFLNRPSGDPDDSAQT